MSKLNRFQRNSGFKINKSIELYAVQSDLNIKIPILKGSSHLALKNFIFSVVILSGWLDYLCLTIIFYETIKIFVVFV